MSDLQRSVTALGLEPSIRKLYDSYDNNGRDEWDGLMEPVGQVTSYTTHIVFSELCLPITKVLVSHG